MMDHYRDELEQHARGCQLPVGNCTDCTTLENLPLIYPRFGGVGLLDNQ